MKTALLSRDNSSILILFFVFILLFVGYRSCHKTLTGGKGIVSPPTESPQKPSTGSGIGIKVLAFKKAPNYVRHLIEYLRGTKHFTPPKGFKGGRVFKNREGILPKNKKYYEFDVHPYTPGVSRGAERIVVDQEKSVYYYTKDHYNTFLKIE